MELLERERQGVSPLRSPAHATLFTHNTASEGAAAVVYLLLVVAHLTLMLPLLLFLSLSLEATTTTSTRERGTTAQPKPFWRVCQSFLDAAAAVFGIYRRRLPILSQEREKAKSVLPISVLFPLLQRKGDFRISAQTRPDQKSDVCVHRRPVFGPPSPDDPHPPSLFHVQQLLNGLVVLEAAAASIARSVLSSRFMVRWLPKRERVPGTLICPGDNLPLLKLSLAASAWMQEPDLDDAKGTKRCCRRKGKGSSEAKLLPRAKIEPIDPLYPGKKSQ